MRKPQFSFLLFLPLVALMATSQSAFADYYTQASQCAGSAKFDSNYARSGNRTDNSSLACWVDVSKGYGKKFQVEIEYSFKPSDTVGSNSSDRDELTCMITSYRKDGSTVHTRSKTITSGGTNKTMLIEQEKVSPNSSGSSTVDPKLARILCTLPPFHTDPRSGKDPEWGAWIRQIRIF